MIVEVGLVVVAGVAVYEYFHNASFKKALTNDIAAVEVEVSSLKTKATSAVKVMATDFAKVETAVKSLVSKL